MSCTYMFKRGMRKGAVCGSPVAHDECYCRPHANKANRKAASAGFPSGNSLDIAIQLIVCPNTSTDADGNYKFISLDKLPECLAYFYDEQNIDDLQDDGASEQFTLTLLCANREPVEMSLEMSSAGISLQHSGNIIRAKSVQRDDCHILMEYIRQRAMEMPATSCLF